MKSIIILYSCIHLMLSCVTRVLTIPMYKSCMDVLNDQKQNATDGEYVLFLESNVGISIYCHDFGSGQPKEFLTLKAERSSNFASFFVHIGSRDACTELSPVQNYSQWGTTEYSKLRLNTRNLVVDTTDFTFSHQLGPNKIRYARAGDKFSSSPDCQPMGAFQIDLSGTPVSLVPDTRWAWIGNYTRGNVIDGQARVKNDTQLGCWRSVEEMRRGPIIVEETDMTQFMCVKECRKFGYKYAGLRLGVQCRCFSSFGTSGPATDDLCNKPCAGDPNQICGGLSSFSVFRTEVGQIFSGRCGGYPGYCYPTAATSPAEEKLRLKLVDDHPCLTSPCVNEGKCVADSFSLYHCLCYPGYGGPHCSEREQIITNTVCPPGYEPERCRCVEPSCTGAKFDGNKTCIAFDGKPETTCRPSDPGHIMYVDIEGDMSRNELVCPENGVPVSCTYFGKGHRYPHTTYGEGTIEGNRCAKTNCGAYNDPGSRWSRWGCQGQLRCKVTVCNCGSHGNCNQVTGLCECENGYYGNRCETFDYCSYYEDLHNISTCSNGGICRAVNKKSIKAHGGDKMGDTCVFPFDYNGVTYSSCVDDNLVGPPFACGGVFRESSGYIDVGQWSPGNKYTIAAWVRPAGVDTIRRTVVGGVQDCNDFGFNLNSGTFRGFLKLSKECTRDLDAGKPHITIGQWYMIAVTNNATHMVIYQNGEYKDSNTVLMNHYPTTAGFRIGGEVCCPTDYFNGWIRTVKVWKRALTREEINRSMYNIGTSNSTTEALYDGLVGHWELADTTLPPCSGIDHNGADWVVEQAQVLSGIHCNISVFLVPKGTTVYIQHYNGTDGGWVEISAKTILIDGTISGNGAGYHGGRPSSKSGGGGFQGDSYRGKGTTAKSANGGGGGGGYGAASTQDSIGRGGGGGGYGRSPGIYDERLNSGAPGEKYGDSSMSTLYLGSGGGSGGNALDLSTSPKGGWGGNGGGAIKLTAEISITVNGQIQMDGNMGQGDIVSNVRNPYQCPKACNMSDCQSNNNLTCWDQSGAGGGGSGGSIYLVAKYVNVGKGMTTLGGAGGKGVLHGPMPPTFTSFSTAGGDGGIGRIRIDSVVFAGHIPDAVGVVYRTNMSNLFYDHSQGGQKLIDPRYTMYGNEVYWGCFASKTLGYALPLTNHIRRLMTPDYCVYRCREKDYKFSGTQNGQECFCDNHITDRLNNKVHDSLCNLSCDGDALQKCGGDNLLQIFGPPPSSPAVGHSVVPKCEPWCVTADSNTANPKWGLCSGEKPVITDWKIQCDCPPGKTGATCDQLCPQWTYGTACKYNCTCNQANTAYCESSTGSCQCKPGFQDSVCNRTCNQGFFGQDCKSSCNCSNNAMCDPQTGICKCRPGWTGLDCQFPCPKNKYGVDCNQTCSCNHGTCSPEHGQCQCDPGYKLPFCYERCDPSSYGQDCLLSCDCNGQFCDAVTGLCHCGPGYIGNKCQTMCPHGTWGQDCHKTCDCENGFGCDHVYGDCQCGSGFIGERCDMQCPFGRYGSDCLGGCTCVMNQTSTCNAINGACFCLPGFLGVSCEKPCNQGYYSEGCKQQCSCLHGANCDPQTGKCICAPGFTGSQCQTPCPDGHYGNLCQGKCSSCNSGICSKVDGSCICKPGTTCICPPGFWGQGCSNACTCVHGSCNPATGYCNCSAGWQGMNCDQPCSSGKYGLGCGSDCKCIHGSCDPVSGYCACNSGFTNASCSVPCKTGKYGPDCLFSCQPCAAHAYPGCDPVSGRCLCSDGFTGSLCDRPCPSGTYGRNCSQSCSCGQGVQCDSVTGNCICPAGVTGVSCDQTCPPGTWGIDCAHTCDCGPHGVGCSPNEGVCICKPGYTGVKCREGCPVNTYGSNCSMPCHCDPFNGRCSPVDGSCLCKLGWTGQFCEAVCDTGTWGRGCTQQCQCNGRGTCDPFTGACDCDAGYQGSACDQQCKQDVFWGENCANTCDCGGGHCDHVTGICTCPAGKMGRHCEHGCDANHFGFLCAQLCGCQNNARCDPVTGFCTCQPGWSGQFCTESCPDGYFGVDCAQMCPLCLNGGSCDTFSGLCHCPDGFTGVVCNTSTVGVVSALTGSKTSPDKDVVTLTSGQLTGLIIGLVLFAIVAVVLAVILTRRKYVGSFGNKAGAVKFQEEVEFKETQRRSDVTATTTGFINPLDIDETVPDSRSEVSESTSGVASNAVESDEEDKNEYFKDSSA